MSKWVIQSVRQWVNLTIVESAGGSRTGRWISPVTITLSVSQSISHGDSPSVTESVSKPNICRICRGIKNWRMDIPGNSYAVGQSVKTSQSVMVTVGLSVTQSVNEPDNCRICRGIENWWINVTGNSYSVGQSVNQLRWQSVCQSLSQCVNLILVETVGGSRTGGWISSGTVKMMSVSVTRVSGVSVSDV